MSNNPPGQIITFYSYKGGTGRTMALANIACLLAQEQAASRGKGVLMVDWDLEAPGLHRYFRNRLKGRLGQPLTEDAIDRSPGLIDIFRELQTVTDDLLNQYTSRPVTSNESDAGINREILAREVLDKVRPEDFALQSTIDSLFLIKAGSFDKNNRDDYSAKVNTFLWEDLYKKSPFLIRLLAERLAERFQYVLIDSRTGITDISGICTMLLPEKLVAVFTPNSQSISGCIEQVKKAADYRRQSSDLRPLVVYPLVTRVEANEPKLREEWRFGNDRNDIAGFQVEFERTFTESYGVAEIRLEKYFDEIQIQQVPRYAYGEEIAVLTEEIRDRFSLKRSYERFSHLLVQPSVSWADDANFEEDKLRPTLSFLRSASSSVRRLIRTHPNTILLTVLILTALSSVILLFLLARVRSERAELTAERARLESERVILTERSKEAKREADRASDEAKQNEALAMDARFEAQKAQEEAAHVRSRLFRLVGANDFRGTIVSQALEIYRLKRRVNELEADSEPE